MTIRRNITIISALATLLVFAGCQTSQNPTGQTTESATNNNGEIQPPNIVTLPGDEEKSLPTEAPSNMPKESEPTTNEEGDLGAASGNDQERIKEAYENQDPSLCQQIEAEALKAACLENLEGSENGADPLENDRESEADYQEYGDTEEPEVSEEEQSA